MWHGDCERVVKGMSNGDHWPQNLMLVIPEGVP